MMGGYLDNDCGWCVRWYGLDGASAGRYGHAKEHGEVSLAVTAHSLKIARVLLDLLVECSAEPLSVLL